MLTILQLVLFTFFFLYTHKMSINYTGEKPTNFADFFNDDASIEWVQALT